MRNAHSMLVVVALAAALPQAGSAAAEQASGDTDAIQDIFYLGDDRLVPIRFHLFVGGKPYRAAWNTFLQELFDRLDADDNDELAGEELRGIPSRSLMENFGMLNGGTVASRLGTEPDAAPRDGKVTRQELAGYFERVGLPPFRISIQSVTTQTRVLRADMAAPDEAPKALLKHLDANGNSKLSAKEFLTAENSLRKQDLDRDEAISMAELAPTTNLFGVVSSASGSSGQRADPRFIALSADSRRSNVDRLLKQFDGRGGPPSAKDRRLSADELGYDKAAFSQLDLDGDGHLDFEETLQLLSNPAPQHEVTVSLGSPQPGKPIIALKDQSAASAEKGVTRMSFGASQLELSANDSSSWGRIETTLTEQFKNIDRDGNGYLEEEETRRFGVLRNRFAMLDTDSDGKVFEKEILAVVSPIFELDARRVRIQIADRGRDLFRIVDTSGDGRIGRRELRSAAERITAWDSDGDGEAELDEIPQQYRLVVSRSMPSLTGSASDVSASVVDGQVRAPQTNSGPIWFNKMDRNNDGDVSSAEFLGTAELFSEFDADGDGLIDASEAAKE